MRQPFCFFGILSAVLVIFMDRYAILRRERIARKIEQIKYELKNLEYEEKELMSKMEDFRILEEFYFQILDMYEKIGYENNFQTISETIFDYFKQMFAVDAMGISGYEGNEEIFHVRKDVEKKFGLSDIPDECGEIGKGYYGKKMERSNITLTLYFHLSSKDAIKDELRIFISTTLIVLMKIYLFQKYDNFSKTDFLTGLFKKRILIEYLIEDFNRCVRKKIPLTISFFDIDDFKSVNDTYGHPVGDKVLMVFSSLLRDLIDQGYIAGRYGGEEFLVLSIGETKESVYETMDNVRRKFEEHDFTEYSIMRKITVSCGLAAFPGDGNTPYELIEAADKKMYGAKRSGKNRIEI